jgi:ABC-type molybdenum transport system ATPase subunit/photorepair protein PhrA
MPTFNIIKEVKPKQTFRVASVIGKFDLQSNNIIEHFEGNIDINDNWQIGLIVGKSGTGKTTIAKQLFEDAYITNFEYSAETILDDMPKECSVEQITNTFNSVGFSSPPSWLKPYSVLSNGEKMRVDLARAILDTNNFFVFDEFTSVVDRDVAQIGSFAMQKAIRKTNKKFIAVTCHFDVEDWLLPDWVFNTDTMTFHSLEGQKKNRPEIKFEFRKITKWNETKQLWRIFKKYHYLTHDLNQNATSYILKYKNNPICFMATMKFPHSKVKNYTRISRLVVLPSFQGIGASRIIQEEVGDILKKQKEILIGNTSHPLIIKYRKNSSKWQLIRYGRGGKSSKANSNYKSKIITENTGKESRNITKNKISTSWKYIG